MRFKRIFLIEPHYREDFYQATSIPVGLGYLASVLKANNIEYVVMDMNIDLGRKYSFGNLAKRIESYKPDLVALSLMSYRYKDHYHIVEKIRRLSGDFKIVAGGAHLSSCREKVLEECSAFDFGIVLEGEETLVELCQGKPEREIKGLIYRDDDSVHFTGERPFIIDLDNIPFPRYEGFELNAYSQEIMPIFTSRGCPFSCIYCAAGEVIGRSIRTRSIASLMEEIEYWYKRGYKEIGIGDDNFTFYKERASLFCEEIIRRGLNKKLRFSLGNGIRADRVDTDLLRLMRKANFYCVAFGIESGNNKVLKNLKKGEHIEVMETAIRNCIELGFEIKLYFLVGSPGETKEDLQDSINFALKYPVRTARFYNLIPYPGTELFDWIRQNNYFTISPEKYLNETSIFDNEPVFTTPALSYSERKIYLKKTDKIRRRIEMKYWRRKWKKLNIFGAIFAWIYMLNIVQRNLVRQRWFMILKNIVRRALRI
jgi:radical SAM superfamily enzyme YgiQ (UPF0313 family)